MTTMEEVLAAHVATTHSIGGNSDGGYQARRCRCGVEVAVHYSEMSDDDIDPRDYLNARFAAHVAQALAVAGFGSQHDAWADGQKAMAHDLAGHPRFGFPGYKETPNPYPAPKVSES